MKSLGKKGTDGGWSVDEVSASFVACARCSYYMSAYRLLHNDLHDAVERSQDGWLQLSWNNETRKLVEDSFGYRIDGDTVHFEGICRECRRSFVLDAAEGEDSPASFSIEIIPGTRA
jgi:hypothetical protein